MEVILAAIVGAISSIILAFMGLYGARRAGLGVTQDKLVSNLQGLVDTLEKKSEEQENRIQAQDNKIINLERKVNELEDLTVQQAGLIKQLLSKRKIVIQNNTADDSTITSR